MYQQESIYNLVPKEKILPGMTTRYHSKYPHWVAPTASTFILNNTSYPNVANMNGDVIFPRGAHPIKENWATMGLPIGGYRQDPEHFYRKGHQYKSIPPPERIRSETEIRKPPIPTIADKPVMGIKSEKNYITSNAIDNILMAPRKINNKEFDYLKKKDYGKVPEYLKKLKKEVEKEYIAIREMQRRNEEEEAKRKKVLSEEEIRTLREGLLKRLEQLKLSYGSITHKKKFDTLVLLRKKESLEKQMAIIEKDLASLNNQKVVVDLNRY
jgi:hypothetical protein